MLASDIQGSFLLTGTAYIPQFMATLVLIYPFLSFAEAGISPIRSLMKL
jgi:hypothetical protein